MAEKFSLDRLFHPSSVAIVGASANPASSGYNFAHYLIDHGFKNRLYLVNPRWDEALGLQVYPSVKDIPESKVDYVICCIPAEGISTLLEDCKSKDVKLIHLFTGTMSETGRDKETRLEHEILEKARNLGIRILGPNCMGIYHPHVGLSFNHDLPKESGPVGGFFQTGGGAGEFVRYAALRGVCCSKIIGYGNDLDINETELLYYFAQDPETKIIAIYMVNNFQELIDQVVAFTFLPPVRGRKVVIAGGGGGKSVVSADVWEEEDFEVPDLSPKLREKLKEKVPQLWDWVRNPIDASLFQNAPLSAMNLLLMISNEDKFDILVANMTQDDPYSRDMWQETFAKDLLDGVLAIKREGKPVICVIETGEIGLSDMESWKWSAIAEIRKHIVSEGIPVFPSSDRAAKAVRRLVDYWVWEEHENEPV